MTTPLKIALVSEHASPLAVLGGVDAGGQNVHVAALADALGGLGHRVTVYTRRDAMGLAVEVPLRQGVIVHHVPAGPAREMSKDDLLPHMGAFGAYLAARWADDPPDIVHGHYWMSGLAALRGTRGLDIPVVQTFHALGKVKRRHQGPADTSPPRRIAAETALGRTCHRIIATCHDEVEELCSMGLPFSKTRVVPCGVDTELFTPRGPAAPRNGRPRLVQIGRLVPRKGADTAISALASIPGAELVIAGGPADDRFEADPEVRRLAALAQRNGVGHRLVLLGGVPREAMPALLRSADLVVCPARYEPFGIVPLEAMACGVPVVASSVGGHLDTVADRTTGRLFPAGNAQALAAAVNELLAAPHLREHYGAAGRRRVLARYGWHQVAAATERVYEELAAYAFGLRGARTSAARGAAPGGNRAPGKGTAPGNGSGTGTTTGAAG
ncbi:glycosyltransferase [Wenjunlia tyrosinilytica]|uniref:Glycosyl transferase n=1 Tax=Wenjunlia tyrosinilytica TaxID=1544741 RepID=A0A917ZKF7_9ACTN|nr:glycosyltransferase [Wenjunlia tyrosinilytica]GGO84705.1 glycosyl transferase [Wenjunlia tyrosinilytica]